MKKGFITIHRKLTEWEWYQDINTCRLFLHLLLTANFEDKKWRGKVIKRGQLITGRLELAKSTGLTEQQIRTSLIKLKSTNEITTTSTSQYTLIEIVNYSLYQDKGVNNNQQNNQEPNQRITNEQPTDNQRITTTKQYNNITNNSINTEYVNNSNYNINSFFSFSDDEKKEKLKSFWKKKNFKSDFEEYFLFRSRTNWKGIDNIKADAQYWENGFLKKNPEVLEEKREIKQKTKEELDIEKECGEKLSRLKFELGKAGFPADTQYFFSAVNKNGDQFEIEARSEKAFKHQELCSNINLKIVKNDEKD